MNIKNKVKMLQITVFVSVDADGNEGIIGQLINDKWMPFVIGDDSDEKIKRLLSLAVRLKNQTGIPFKILKFTTREDITEKFYK